MVRFVHLHLHTEYSLVDSTIRIEDLVTATRAAGMPACAITDQSHLFALVKFYRAAHKAGIKPIIGVDVYISDDADSATRLVLLCQNDTGYRHLMRLISQSYLEGQKSGIPYLQREWLRGATDGLIALSGGHEGDIGKALLGGHSDTAHKLLTDWHALFPQRFYLELHRTGRPHEEDYLHAAVELALATHTPVVATNDVRFLSSDDFESHEVRVCIHDGHTLTDERRARRYSPQQYLRTPSEMAELFADIPEALENTWHIAKRCNLELRLGQNFLPDFPVPTGQTLEDYFRHQAHSGLEQRLTRLFRGHSADLAQRRQPYIERLALELDIIVQMGFAGYFLIVADFIQWAKDNHIPVGPGRGSGAGSLVAYALNITDLDPIKYDLLFERFLNPERISLPDFDVDFCMERRDEVIGYVTQHYGRDRVSQIITYGSLAAKAVVRDVGRVLGHPYGFVDKIAKLIPFELGITLDKALQSEELQARYQKEEEVRVLLDMARKLEGLVRNVGTHAGGVVIAPTQLTDFAPLYCEPGGREIITQFDKDDIESIGLVKFDFLGLRTLTIIKWALEHINVDNDNPVDIADIPLQDSKTFDLFKRGDTTAVFQLESGGIKKLVKRLQPDCFEDLVALVALYRPGPLQSGMVDDFIDRKHGRAAVEYPHPLLQPILKSTYGVIVYQEQVMKIAQVLAGYTLGGADLLRRSMGKKKPEEMAKQRAIFVSGAAKQGIQEETATYIFDLMEHFAGYGFNVAHATAYALLSYQTAWLKAHYPAAFMAAVLSSEMADTEKVVDLLTECRAMRLKILTPAINGSDYLFTIDTRQGSAIRYGLGAIKGVGEAALQGIITERKQHGSFQDLFDFCRRIDLRKANRRVLEALTKAGALDELGPSRAIIMASLDAAIKLAEQHANNRQTGQKDLFGLSQPQAQSTRDTKPFVMNATWTDAEKLQAEKETLGYYVSGHPFEKYAAELSHWVRGRLSEVRPGTDVRVAGWVTDVRFAQSRQGRLAVVTLEESSGRLEATIYTELLASTEDSLIKDQVLLVEGEIREDKFNNNYTLIANRVFTLAQAREIFGKNLIITVTAAQVQGDLTAQLLEILTTRKGRCTVMVRYQRPEAEIELILGDTWSVKPSEDLLQRLKTLVGEDQVRMIYARSST